MITSKNRITRRSVLRGAGGIAVALPFLDAMLLPRQSHAAGSVPLRLVVFYSPGGTLLDQWRPTGTETNFTLSSMMAPLNPFKDRVILVDGLDLSVAINKGVGHPHSRGMAGVLTGTQLLPGTFETGAGGASFADGPSVDQVIAGRNSAGLKFKSLEYSSGWSISGRSAGETAYAANIINMAGSKMPIAPQVNAIAAFKRIFSMVGESAGMMAGANARQQSILDAVMGQYTKISAKLGPSDKQKLSDHLDMIRQMEASLAAPSGGGTSCVVPPMPTIGDNAVTSSTASGSGVDVTATLVPQKGQAMVDLLVASLACDLTRVGTMIWADSEAKFIMDFDPLKLPDYHHAYQHEHGFQPDALNKIYTWYAQNFAYLLQKLDAVKEADGTTLLDNTLVVWVTEIQKPDTHGQTNVPYVLAGKAQGRVRPGRWLQVKSGTPNNNLLVTILNIFGGTEQTFGDPMYCTGPLAGIT
ncbi:MAG: DUF1552 domain-containing protein [Polyangiaceae bacterium]